MMRSRGSLDWRPRMPAFENAVVQNAPVGIEYKDRNWPKADGQKQPASSPLKARILQNQILRGTKKLAIC